MLFIKRRERNMLDKTSSTLISNLKGRVSRALNVRSSLPLEEISGLEGIYHAIDDFIMSDKEKTDILNFKEELLLHSKFIKDTKKNYIKEHIIPVINKISTKKWGGNE